MLEINKVYNMDCLDGMKLIDTKSVDLIVTDPPYNIHIADWDTWKTVDEYIEFMGKVFIECQRVLKDNGSMYFWHNDMNQISRLMEWLRTNTNFIFNSFIIWDKGDFRSLSWKNPSDDNNLRSWFNTCEYCLYYTFQDGTGLEEITDKFIKPKNPFAKYLREEFSRAKITNKEIAKLFPSKTGGLTGCVSNWLNGDNIITEEQYNIIRNYLGKDYLRQEYESLRQEYESLRQEYESLRYKHNLDKNHNNIWKCSQKNNGKFHPCEKPTDLISRIIKCSSNKGELVLDMFVGSGTTAVACHKLQRNFIGFELDKHYYDLGQQRLGQEQAQINMFDLMEE